MNHFQSGKAVPDFRKTTDQCAGFQGVVLVGGEMEEF